MLVKDCLEEIKEKQLLTYRTKYFIVWNLKNRKMNELNGQQGKKFAPSSCKEIYN